MTTTYPATTYRGQPVSDGLAAGELYQVDALVTPAALIASANPDFTPIASTVTADDVRAAFAAVAAERAGLASRLRAEGREHDAGIVDIGALMAADSALTAPAAGAIGEAAVPLAVASTAVRDAVEAQARILESLPDPDLAQRASDVRQVAAAVIALLSGAVAPPPSGRPFILIAREVDPADLIRLADTGLAGAVSVGGGGSSHAAIIARGLGLPMLAGADPAVLSVPAGHPAILDAQAGALTIDPSRADLERAGLDPAGRDVASAPPQRGASSGGTARGENRVPTGSAAPGSPVTVPLAVMTADGQRVTLLCNVASAAETRLGLSRGAAGVGLLRTEIPFTKARDWPSYDEHLAALSPVLSLLAGRTAVVRLLDFAGDKIPPFPGAEGLTALLSAPRALAGQLAAVLEAGRDARLSIMIPMVRELSEVQAVRAELDRVAREAGVPPPPLGIMVEVASTAVSAARFAEQVDFFSIGTNDLTAQVLGRDRPALRPADSADPAVLGLIRRVVQAGHSAGIGVSVCGDAAADPAVLPALIGAGVRTISVGAARVPQVAAWVAGVSAIEAAEALSTGVGEP